MYNCKVLSLQERVVGPHLSATTMLPKGNMLLRKGAIDLVHLQSIFPAGSREMTGWHLQGAKIHSGSVKVVTDQLTMEM